MKVFLLLLLFASQVLPSVSLIPSVPSIPGLPTGSIPTVCAVPTKRHVYPPRKFRNLTGFPNGRPGYVVDHIVPLCACGADAVENMQWQTVQDAAVKDEWERELCKTLRTATKGDAK